MGVAREAVEEPLQVLVQQGVALNLGGEPVQLLPGGQLAVDQQVADLDEGRLLGQLLDRVSAVPKDPGVAVDVGDRALRRGGVDEARVERRVAGLGQQRIQVDPVGALGGGHDVELQLAPGKLKVGDLGGSGVIGHGDPFFAAERGDCQQNGSRNFTGAPTWGGKGCYAGTRRAVIRSVNWANVSSRRATSMSTVTCGQSVVGPRSASAVSMTADHTAIARCSLRSSRPTPIRSASATVTAWRRNSPAAKRNAGDDVTIRAVVNSRSAVNPPGGADALARTMSMCAARSASSSLSPAGWRLSSAAIASTRSSMSANTTASFVAKYRLNVRGDTSATAAIWSTVVRSNPCRSHSSIAASISMDRVRCFLRSRSPGTAAPTPSTTPQILTRQGGMQVQLPTSEKRGRLTFVELRPFDMHVNGVPGRPVADERRHRQRGDQHPDHHQHAAPGRGNRGADHRRGRAVNGVGEPGSAGHHDGEHALQPAAQFV